jgi:glycogen operon protein
VKPQVGTGHALPLGVHEHCGGVNLAIFSRHASAMSLLLFDQPEDEAPRLTVELDPRRHRTGDVWHVWLAGLQLPLIYALVADGPNRPELGLRFDPARILLDPYAKALVGTHCWDFGCVPQPARGRGRAAKATLMHSDARWKAKGLVQAQPFDWDGDLPLALPWSQTLIYETHVRGLTIHPSSGASHPGTFLGVIEKISYLKELGITAVELMPVQEFNERELVDSNPATGERLLNYWGYSTAAFFAPKESYSSRSYAGCQLDEFRTMVRELHRAGIEVILDVVFNHTAEGDHTGPTLSFRGLDNPIYYMLEDDPRYYRNYSGCGNTLNCNHPVVRDYILDCLRYWVTHMHVDGLRFDLASVLGRDRQGNLLANPPLIERIAEDPVLRATKLIAEAWDAAGAYQVGSFPGLRWSEWNGRYRDEVRRFWRGDPGMVGALAMRLCGSADLYQRAGRTPMNSINFVACHDGFTLNDLVSYRDKHNEANGEDNRDGSSDNLSDNYGTEGPSDDPEIEQVRLRQIKNLLATLLVSRGVPMLLGGDEFRRSQQGNNNAYCQDSELSWYDWALARRNREVLRFVREMIALRRRYPVLTAERFYTEQEIDWFDGDGGPMRWDGGGRTLGCRISPAESEGPPLCLLFNANPERVEFVLPAAPEGYSWRTAVDTGQPSPRDVIAAGERTPALAQERYGLAARAMAVLAAS